MKFKNIIGHFKTICIHKFWVGYYCFKSRLYWQGITHDLSKFSLTEFFESVKYYTGINSPIDNCKKKNGFSNAWMHHKGRNKHHYEYWQDNFDSGTTHIKMPYRYALEMVCDFLGAGRAYNGKNFTYQNEIKWWENKKSNSIAMHLLTIEFVDILLLALSKYGSDILKDKDFMNTLKQSYELDIITTWRKIKWEN